jgi:hypothetical protein
MNKDLQILESLLKNLIHKITDEKSTKQISLEQPEVLL